MTLPRKPSGVLDVQEEEKIRKERDVLGKPSNINGMTLDKVPGGNYKLIDKPVVRDQWYVPAENWSGGFELTRESENTLYKSGDERIKNKTLRNLNNDQLGEMRGLIKELNNINKGRQFVQITKHDDKRFAKKKMATNEKYKEWEWQDPHKGTREKLHKMEIDRIGKINKIDERLKDPVWGRTRKKTITNRPGTRGGKTILTGGIGTDEDQPLLFSGGKGRT